MKLRNIIKDKGKKAQGNQFSIFGIFLFMITALVVVLFFAGLIYIQGLLHSTFDSAGIQNEVNAGKAGYTNMSAASDEIWGTLDDAIQSLKLVAGVYVLALAAIMIITNALVKIHPLWFFAYILLSILAVVFAVPISNAYQQLYLQTPAAFGGELSGFTIANWVLFYLPVFVLILSVLGGIFLFINIIRQESGGTFS